MLNLFPLPNATDPSGSRQYNYTYQNELDKPRNDQVTRVDYNINRDTTFYTRVQFGNEVNSRGANAFLGAGTGNGGNAGWPQFNTSYEVGSVSMVSTLLHTFNATTVGEVTIGRNWAEQLVSHVSQDALDQNDRRVVLAGLGQFFPSANPQYLVPQISYGGTNALPNTRGVGVADRYPFNASNTIWNYSANLSKIAGRHNLKTGVFFEHTARPAPRAAVFNGNFNFDGNASNPFDTNLGFANALLGSINSYTESTAKPYAEGRFNQVEIFVQDNWRVTSRLTLDFGARFYYIGPTYVVGSGRVVLRRQPVGLGRRRRCSSSPSARTTRRPAPATSGRRGIRSPARSSTTPTSTSWCRTPATSTKAWSSPRRRSTTARDCFRRRALASRGTCSATARRRFVADGASSTTAIRTTSSCRSSSSRRSWTRGRRASRRLRDLQNSQLIQSPRGVTAFAEFEAPTVYNWSIGVQHALPWNLIADVAYVGNAGRNQPVTASDQRPALRHAAAAAERRSDQRRSAGRDQLPASLPRLRRDRRA